MTTHRTGRWPVALAAVVLVTVVLLGLWWRSGTAPQGSAAREDAGEERPQPVSAAKTGRSAAGPTAPGADGGGAPTRDQAVLAQLGWGAGRNQVGRERPEEANPEGPMSFALDRQGRAVLLDQVNGRILRLDADGNPLDELPLPVRAAQDLAVGEDGRMAVLDRLADRTVAILDGEGRLVGELPLEGPGIEEGGGVTGVFVDGQDVYVEREHAALVKVGDLSGKPDPDRAEIPGRPSRDGKYFLNAGLIDPPAGRAYLNALSRPEQNHLYTREYQLGAPVMTILALDTDLQGVVYLALMVELQQGSTEAPPGYVIRLLCLNAPDGAPLGQTELPVTTLPEESFRDLVVQDQGGVIYAYRTEEGVTYQRADCR